MNFSVLEQFGPQQPQLSDDQLLSQAKSGDRQAFGELCQRYSAMLKRAIFRIVQHREDTEDVLQETLLSAHQHLHTFRGTCKFSSWITKIGINRSLLLLRKRKTSSRIASAGIKDDSQTLDIWEFRDPRPDPEQCYIADQTLLALRNAIQRLPLKMRNVIDLYYGREHRLKDAASILGITELAARSRVLRARHMLRRALRNQFNPGEVNHKSLESPPQARRNCRPSQIRNRPRAHNHLTVSDGVALVQSECPSPLTHEGTRQGLTQHRELAV